MTCKLAAPYPEAPPSQPSPQKVVLITDGLSHAGLAIATYLSRSGHHVFGTVLQTAHTAARLPFEPLQVDPRCDGSVRQAVAQLINTTGRVDALVNNSDACIAAAFEEMSLTQARQLFEAKFFDAPRITNRWPCALSRHLMRHASGSRKLVGQPRSGSTPRRHPRFLHPARHQAPRTLLHPPPRPTFEPPRSKSLRRAATSQRPRSGSRSRQLARQ